MEERIARLEALLHRLLCCTPPVVGPQGPQGPMGNPGEDGIQGPPGADGAIIFENLNWLGEFVSGLVYNQFDAVSYNGSSYFMNCESNETFESETPDMNPSCWILLANAGATGPQGPTGLTGLEGNDGSNSGRWVFYGPATAGNPGSTYFSTNSVVLSEVTDIAISYDDHNITDYETWFKFLRDISILYNPVVFLQITEVGSNNIIGIYKLRYEASEPVIESFSTHIILGVETILPTTEELVKQKTYTISWSIHSLGQMAPKTIGTVIASELGAELAYDFNLVTNEDSRTYSVYLPGVEVIGKEIVVYSKSPSNGNLGFYVNSNSEITIPLGVPISTGYIANQGIDNGESNYYVWPNGNYKFTFLGNTAAGGKALWSMEALPNTYVGLNYASEPKFTSSTELNSYYIELSTSVLNAAALELLYPNLNAGEQVFAPNQPGGAKMFVKNETQWLSFTLNPVL